MPGRRFGPRTVLVSCEAEISPSPTIVSFHVGTSSAFASVPFTCQWCILSKHPQIGQHAPNLAPQIKPSIPQVAPFSVELSGVGTNWFGAKGQKGPKPQTFRVPQSHVLRTCICPCSAHVVQEARNTAIGFRQINDLGAVWCPTCG